MNQNVIGITGVGGGVGQSILKAMYNTNYKLIALDGELLSSGLYASPTSYIIPYANSTEYIIKLIEICKTEKINILFPGLDAELMPLSINRDKFLEIGTNVIVSNKHVIEISDDKLLLAKELNKIGINTPLTKNLKDVNIKEFAFPVIIKQMIGGARSKNIFLIKSNKEFLDFQENNIEIQDKFIVQEYIEGDEYTCGSITLNDNLSGIIIMRRILRDGDTYKCFVEKNEVIEETIRTLLKSIKPYGACNIQLRMKNKIPYIFEINARCSGTTAARALSGFNEPLMITDYFLKNIEPKYTIENVTILRYWKELIINNHQISELENKGFYKSDSFSKL